MTTAERETLDIDVLFVGAGPASLAGAYHLAKLLAHYNQQAASGRAIELSIAVLEKGSEVGAHGISGAIVDPRSLRELFPEKFASIPFEAEVSREHVWWLTEEKAISLPEPPPLKNHGNYVASLGKLVKWMAKEVEAVGVDIFCEFPGRSLLYEDTPAGLGRRVAGVRTGDKGVGKDGKRKANFEPGVDIRSQMTVLGEGPRGTLAKQLESRFGLCEGKNPQVYALGMKEVWELPKGRFEPGEIWHTMGWPMWPDHFGGGFIYGMQDNLLIVGLVYGLDYENPLDDPHLEFQRMKTHPAIAKLLAGGTMSYYGAKAIPESGYWAMPKLGGDGFCMIGDSGGFVDGQRLKGIHLAMKSGMLAAESIFAAAVAGRPISSAGDDFPGRFEASWARTELWKSRNFHQAFERGGFDAMVNAALGTVTGGKGWGLVDRLPAEAGHERLHRLDSERSDYRPAAPLVFDGKLTFDRLADVYNSGAAQEEDQPVHLLVADTSICVDRCVREFGNPCTRFCPAGVYEMVADNTVPAGKRLQINASNCVHCKTCDIMDPYQIIDWVPPEGGGGPNYGKM
ncbi:MAG: electron transfer flavoprotein-ubiquinone oxidoreductase [Thermoanaerobaculia bacterium]